MSGESNLIYIELADRNGYVARTDAYFTVDPATTVADVRTAAADLLTKVQNCSGGRIVRAQARLGLDVSSFATHPLEDAATAAFCVTLAFAHNGADALPWDFVVPAVSLSVLNGALPDMSEDATIDLLADTLENVTPPILGWAYLTNRGGALLPTADGFCSARKLSRVSARQSMEVGN